MNACRHGEVESLSLDDFDVLYYSTDLVHNRSVFPSEMLREIVIRT